MTENGCVCVCVCMCKDVSVCPGDVKMVPGILATSVAKFDIKNKSIKQRKKFLEAEHYQFTFKI